jgi:hypothetical protein
MERLLSRLRTPWDHEPDVEPGGWSAACLKPQRGRRPGRLRVETTRGPSDGSRLALQAVISRRAVRWNFDLQHAVGRYWAGRDVGPGPGDQVRAALKMIP